MRQTKADRLLCVSRVCAWQELPDLSSCTLPLGHMRKSLLSLYTILVFWAPNCAQEDPQVCDSFCSWKWCPEEPAVPEVFLSQPGCQGGGRRAPARGSRLVAPRGFPGKAPSTSGAAPCVWTSFGVRDISPVTLPSHCGRVTRPRDCGQPGAGSHGRLWRGRSQVGAQRGKWCSGSNANCHLGWGTSW